MAKALLDLETDGASGRKRSRIGGDLRRPPTFEELERRCGTGDGELEIQVRLDLACKQQTLKDRFDHMIVNDDVERAAQELTEIVRRELQTAGTMSRP